MCPRPKPSRNQNYFRTERAVIDKSSMSERDICTKFITPALKRAGWDELTQIREEVGFTKGRIIVRGKLVTRGKAKRADYVLYYKNNLPIALIEAKDNNHSVGDGMQQGLEYAETLEIPFVFSSNGDGFIVSSLDLNPRLQTGRGFSRFFVHRLTP
jgi:type I restriction enzyme, R subunit